MLLNLSVSVGTINGVFQRIVSQFISWLNLDIGIDEVCLFDGLDGY